MNLAQPFLQAGILGAVVVALAGVVVVLWRQSTAALKREQDINDQLRKRIDDIQTIQAQQYLGTISNATQAITEVIGFVRGIGK